MVNHMADRIVRLDMDIRQREQAISAGTTSIPHRFAVKAVGRLRAQRIEFADAMYAAYGFERAAELIHEVRMELDADYARSVEPAGRPNTLDGWPLLPGEHLLGPAR